ncbi:hypothetical protein PtA15_16A167 [Puccinia triticina]|uniref:aspartate--tRNA ligase n=1 Tax=Puccinia triticina TaxID=208348 RepID=A0ABY7D7D6_9BASI|nr:uncharacterized protein PtA15_16A167 [Puccinia triticina]WAQ92261.1 hypothetical protein PtA15_16A167 [Puccinia triticina]
MAEQEPLSKSALKKLEKEREKAAKKLERQAKEAQEKASREATQTDYALQNYGKTPLNMSQERSHLTWARIAELKPEMVGQRVRIQARVHNSRSQSKHHRSSITHPKNLTVDDGVQTPVNQAIFRVQSRVCNLFRRFLDDEGFIEIHTPKIQGAATESGASVFKLGYFEQTAFLAQSPQLAKQMAIAADFERVYEIGPVFRAENSNTYRHMTEFIGLDLEMAINEHYHEAVDLLDRLFLSIFKGLQASSAPEIQTIKSQHPLDDFTFLDQTLRLSHKEAVQILIDNGIDIQLGQDMGTEQERILGKLIKEKYHTDYYIIDKFPLAIRPFYTMPDPVDPTLSNSYDFFMRGEEIISGAQRIHDPELLTARMKEAGIDPAQMKGYLDGFRLACPAHAGGGIGLERVVMLFFGLGNIRKACLFPRDPKRLHP